MQRFRPFKDKILPQMHIQSSRKIPLNQDVLHKNKFIHISSCKDQRIPSKDAPHLKNNELNTPIADFSILKQISSDSLSYYSLHTILNVSSTDKGEDIWRRQLGKRDFHSVSIWNGFRPSCRCVIHTTVPRFYTTDDNVSSEERRSDDLNMNKTDVLPSSKSKKNKSTGNSKSRNSQDLVTEREKIWDARFEQLLDFKEKHGHTNVPKTSKNNDYAALGRWVYNQRHIHKHKEEKHQVLLNPLNDTGRERDSTNASTTTLTPHMKSRFAKLDSIEFIWDINVAEWERNFEKLIKFKEIHGHANPSALLPFLCPSSPFKNLISWTMRQNRYRKRNNNGRKGAATSSKNQTILTEEMESRLTELGYEWKGSSYTKWIEKLEELGKFKKQFGHLDITSVILEHKNGQGGVGSTKVTKKYLSLSRWLTDQRVRYHKWKKKDNNRTLNNSPRDSGDNVSFKGQEEKYKALEILGVSFEDVSTIKWNEMFFQLRKYNTQYGDCQVPQNYKPNPKLGRWVYNQRVLYKKLRCSTEKLPLRKGQEVDDDDETKSKKITPNEFFDNIDDVDEINKNLSLSDERIELLNTEGFVWNTSKVLKNQSKMESFQSFIEDLRYFRKIHGHTCVPPMYTKNKPLARWVSRVRVAFARKETENMKDLHLSSEEIQSLNELGFVWERKEADWWSTFYRFKNYHQTEKDVVSVHSASKKLRKWLNEQKDQERHFSLSDEKVAALDSLTILLDEQNVPYLSNNKRDLFKREKVRNWNEMFETLKSFHAEFGTSNVPQIYPSDPELGIWVTLQRERYQKKILSYSKSSVLSNKHVFDSIIYNKDNTNIKVSTLDVVNNCISDDELTTLNSLDFAWDTEALKWETCYHDLLSFKATHGHCEVPVWYGPNPNLGSWIFEQKQAYGLFLKNHPSNMSESRVELLEDAGVAWCCRKNNMKNDIKLR